MTESDEWATVETVVDEELDSNDETIYRQGPSGIDQGILEKSRLTLYGFSDIANSKLYYCFYIFCSTFHPQ